MHVSLTCIWITLLLVVLLLGIGAISYLMASLVVVLAWHVARWNAGASLPYATLWLGNRKGLAIQFLGLTGLYLLLRWSILWSKWAEMRSRSNRRF